MDEDVSKSLKTLNGLTVKGFIILYLKLLFIFIIIKTIIYGVNYFWGIQINWYEVLIAFLVYYLLRYTYRKRFKANK